MRPFSGSFRRRRPGPLAGAALALLAAGCAGVPPAPTGLADVADLAGANPPRDPEWARRRVAEGDAAWEARSAPGRLADARQAYWEAATADPELYEAYWKAARACAVLGQRETDPALRQEAFRRGAGTALLALGLEPDGPEGHYHYATNLGLLAREKPSSGIASVKEMIPHLEAAAAADPALEHGGPHRALALVYLRAPAWPVGPGDELAGLEQAELAVQVAPDYPPNHLALAEARTADGAPGPARESLARARELAASGPWRDEERREFEAEADRLARQIPQR